MASRPTRIGAVLGSLAAATILTTTAPASAQDPDGAPDRSSQAAALERDLGLSPAEAEARFASEATAAQAEQTAVAQLGTSYAGSWYDAERGVLVVAVAGPTTKAAVPNAELVSVEHAGAELESAKAALDASAEQAPDTVAGWHVDPASNQVVVTTRDVAAAESFVAASGAAPELVTVQHAPENPQPLADVVGGESYFINNQYRCSVGFAVQGGFVTAGHCGSTGDSTTEPTGTFAGSSFPGNDYAWVRTPNDRPVGAVDNYSGGRVAVKGSTDAPIGSSICRSGSTTGWHCGTIQARSSTVNYPEGSVSGLIRTTVCAEQGDSGGSAISGNQAQGVTSGGSGNCSSGGTTYFQPVNEILNAYGLSLITS
ncbi:S1 family peptidase [Aeromicrobium sp. Leaf350]|uniref:S1 family peptidase n=1 Tax=Aeromicrobium sp. Leaf350 TaxID=2876565 RepID=UPI001E4A012B|nr:S1 family peptidase [Aeromicrobium sp. Leaf350]